MTSVNDPYDHASAHGLGVHTDLNPSDNEVCTHPNTNLLSPSPHYVDSHHHDQTNTTTPSALRSSSQIPSGYITPPFPSLYYPFPVTSTHGSFLYTTFDAWRFTLFWTLIFYSVLHLVAGCYAVAIQLQNWRVIWVAPVVFLVVGGIEAVVAGSIVGAL